MARQIEIFFTKRNVRGVATLLDDEAPLTCDAVWNALPLEGDAYHARWAGREVYTLVPPLDTDPGKENATIMPIAGDLLYFEVQAASIDIPPERRTGQPFIDIALFYGRNNFLLGPKATCQAISSPPLPKTLKGWPRPARASGVKASSANAW